MGDGAAANVIMSEEALNKYGVTPLARIVSWGVAAVEPTLMGVGPVEAVRTALKRARLELDDIDILELNEVGTVLVWWNMLADLYSGFRSAVDRGAERTWILKRESQYVR